MTADTKTRGEQRGGFLAGLEALREAVPIRAWSGPLTEELVRNPGKFGLGQVPARLAPDATTTMVCGFCSTGCGLNIHLRDGQAVNLSADTSYPVNLGMACPKGWEALTPLSAPDRGTTPLVRARRDAALEPCDWERAMVLFCERFKEIQAKHGPESVAFLSTGQIATEEMAFSVPLQVRHGHSCIATAIRASAWRLRMSRTSSPSALTRRLLLTRISNNPTCLSSSAPIRASLIR